MGMLLANTNSSIRLALKGISNFASLRTHYVTTSGFWNNTAARLDHTPTSSKTPTATYILILAHKNTTLKTQEMSRHSNPSKEQRK